MTSSYLKLMFRNFIRNKVFPFINIIGLAVGIACVILIISWVKLELSFDQYHEYSDRIYRVQRKPFCTQAPSFASLMRQDFPEIEKLARMVNVAYYLMYKWLQNFAYKIAINLWIFIIPGFIAFFIAFLTVSWQSWKAANRNPVEALKYE